MKNTLKKKKIAKRFPGSPSPQRRWLGQGLQHPSPSGLGGGSWSSLRAGPGAGGWPLPGGGSTSGGRSSVSIWSQRRGPQLGLEGRGQAVQVGPSRQGRRPAGLGLGTQEGPEQGDGDEEEAAAA